MIEDSKVKDLVIEKIIQAGWKKADILLDQRITSEGRLIQVDLLILYELYPLAVIQVKSSTKSVESGAEQALVYSDIIGVPFAFSTNGIVIIEVKQKNVPVDYDQFPSPKTLWKELG